MYIIAIKSPSASEQHANKTKQCTNKPERKRGRNLLIITAF